MGFVFFFLLELKLNFLKIFFLLLSLISEQLDFLFLLFKFLNISKNRIIKLKSRWGFEVLISLIFINVNYFSLDNLFARTLFWLNVFLFKLLFGDVDQIGDVSWWFWIFRGLTCSKPEVRFFRSYFYGRTFFFPCLFIIFFDFLEIYWAYIRNIFYCWLINIPELEKKLFYLTKRLDWYFINFSV